jgi:acyl dehydratase
VGKFFEELDEGFSLSSPPRTVAGEDIDIFIRLSGDDNRLHTDDNFARENGFSGRIAHGALVVSIATGLAWQTGVLQDTTIAFRAIDEWKFTAPVYPGDTITLRGKVGERRPLPRAKAGLVAFELEVVNQDGQVVCTGRLRMLMRMKTPVLRQPAY